MTVRKKKEWKEIHGTIVELLFLRWKKKNRIRELGIIGVCQTPSLSIEQACARNSGEFQEPFTLSQYLVHKRHKLSLSVRLQCVFQPKYVIWGSATSNLVCYGMPGTVSFVESIILL